MHGEEKNQVLDYDQIVKRDYISTMIEQKHENQNFNYSNLATPTNKNNKDTRETYNQRDTIQMQNKFDPVDKTRPTFDPH